MSLINDSHKLQIIIDSYKKWLEQNDQENDNIQSKRARQRELQDTLLNKEFVENSATKEFTTEVKKYINSLDGPVQIHFGVNLLTNSEKDLKILYCT
jgi:hypothetical protein